VNCLNFVIAAVFPRKGVFHCSDEARQENGTLFATILFHHVAAILRHPPKGSRRPQPDVMISGAEKETSSVSGNTGRTRVRSAAA
jgi:hypothetical protein